MIGQVEIVAAQRLMTSCPALVPSIATCGPCGDKIARSRLVKPSRSMLSSAAVAAARMEPFMACLSIDELQLL